MRIYEWLLFGAVGTIACADTFQREATLASLVAEKKSAYTLLARKAAREAYHVFEGDAQDDSNDAELQSMCDKEFGELVSLFDGIDEEQDKVQDAQERLAKTTDSRAREQIEHEIAQHAERIDQLQVLFAHRIILLGSLFVGEVCRQAPEHPEVQALFHAVTDACAECSVV